MSPEEKKVLELKKIRDELAEAALLLNELADKLHSLATGEVPQ